MAELITELTLVGVADPGVPNEERIILRPTQEVRLHEFGLGIGIPEGINSARPIFDQLFWFPDLPIHPPAWIFVYTGKGEQRWTTTTDGNIGLVLHWQREYTLFGAANLTPILIRLGGVAIGPVVIPAVREALG